MPDENERAGGRRRWNSRPLISVAALSLACCALVPAARAQWPTQTLPPRPEPAAKSPQQPQRQPAPGDKTAAALRYFTDVELIDHDGRKVRLYSDLLKDKVVVINAFFATCQGTCLPMNENLRKVQAAFRERLGGDLYIISISVDPETDTPAALAAYAKKLGAAPGRFFVSGGRENVSLALKKLGQYVEQREQHTNIFIVGNERTGLWKKVFGLAKADEIIRIVESVLNDGAQPGGAAK